MQGCLGQALFGQVILAELEIGPAQGVEVGAVGGLQGDGLLDVVERIFELHAAIGIHVTEIVEGDGALRVDGEYFPEFSFRLVVFLFAFIGGAAQEVNIFLVFGLGGKKFGLVERLLGITPALQARVHDGEADVDVAILRRAFEQRADIGERLVGIAGVGELSVQHHAQVAVVRQFLHGFFGYGGSFGPLLGFAVGIDDVLIAGFGVVLAADSQQLAEGFDRRGIVFLVAIDHAQALDKDSAIVAVGLGVAIVGLLGFLQQILQNLYGFVVARLRLVNHRDVVWNFEGIGDHGFGFFQAVESLIVLALAAVNLRNTKVGLGVFRIRVGDHFVLIEGSVNLAVV